MYLTRDELIEVFRCVGENLNLRIPNGERPNSNLRYIKANLKAMYLNVKRFSLNFRYIRMNLIVNVSKMRNNLTCFLYTLR